MSDRLAELRAALARGAKPAAQSTALVPSGPVTVRTSGHKSTGGTPQVEITEAGLEQIRRDRANGCSLETIAGRLGISRTALGKLRQRDPRVEEALVMGHAACEDELVDILMKKARSADSDRDQIISAIFLLKSRMGYRDTGPLDGAAATVNVQIKQVENLTTEEIRRRIDELMAARERLLNGDTEEIQDAEVIEAGQSDA